MLSEKPWRGEVVMQFIAAQFVFFFIGASAIGLLQKLGIGGFKQPEDFGNILLGTLCFQGATWILIPVFLRKHQVGWLAIFDSHGKNLRRALLMAAVVVAVILPVAWLLQGASAAALEKIGWPREDQAAVLLFAGAKSIWLKIYLGVFALVIAPVAEEFIFRGMLYPFVKRLGSPRYAFFGISAIFAEIHFDAGTLVPLFALALALTWLYEFTDNLLAPIFAHSLFNAVNLVILFFCAKMK
jgi:membrane protease YdiL (CAAX protease family)